MNELLERRTCPHDEWDTVGGLVFNTLGHVPDEGECVRSTGLEFCAERVQGRRIVSVLIRRSPRQPARASPAEERDASDRSSLTFRSGFVSVVGRPNVGKSTLVNQLVGRKVSIVSDRPQTTRTQIRGVRTTAATPDRVPRHARRPQAADAARGAHQRACRCRRSPRSTSSASSSRRPRRSDRATGSSPSSCAQVVDAGDPRRQQDRRGAEPGRRSPSTSPSRRRARRLRRVRAAVGRHRRRRRRAGRRARGAACPRARTTTRTGS